MKTYSILFIFLFFGTTTIAQVEEEEDVFIIEEIEPEYEGEPIFDIVEIMPEFPGGKDALKQYLGENLIYPRKAADKGIQGKVYVQFIVEKDGSITSIKILRGIGGGCDEESVRVVKIMPKWEHGSQRGKPVRVRYTIPIVFKLTSPKEERQRKREEKEKR